MSLTVLETLALQIYRRSARQPLYEIHDKICIVFTGPDNPVDQSPELHMQALKTLRSSVVMLLQTTGPEDLTEQQYLHKCFAHLMITP